jgi:hypothetical protein
MDRVASYSGHFLVSAPFISGSVPDYIVWLLPVMLELECSAYQLSLFGITSYQAAVRARISQAFADIEK